MAPTPSTPARRDRLKVGEGLKVNEALLSANGKYKLVMQSDGNLALYQNGNAWWDSRSGSSMSSNLNVEMQKDGNLVLYRDGRISWATNTDGRGDASSVLLLEDNGNLTISSNKKEIWSANTKETEYKPRPKPDRLAVGEILKRGEFLMSPNMMFKFTLQLNGVLVLSDSANNSLLALGNEGPNFAQLNGDGALILWSNQGTKSWNTLPGLGNATSVLILQDDGILNIFSEGKKIWTTDTPDHLKVGQTLQLGEHLVSSNKRFTIGLDVETAMGMVILEKDQPRWSTKLPTPSSVPFTITMQDDDNLVVGDTDRANVWTSNTRRRPGGGTAIFRILDSGDAVVQSDGIIIWSNNLSLIQPWIPIGTTPVPNNSDRMKTGQHLLVGQSITSANKQFSFTPQTDGNLVVRRNTTNEVVWSSKKPGDNPVHVALNWNNNLIMCGTNGKRIWSSEFTLDGSQSLIMGDDGFLTIKSGPRQWSTKTSVK